MQNSTFSPIAVMRRALTAWTLKTGRGLSLYRRICHPDGQAWANVLKRYGGLYQMGDGCFIQANVVFTDPAFVRLGNNVHLTGCTLFGHDGSVSMLKIAYGLKLDKVGYIDIGDHVFVGHQAIIMPNIRIGSYAIVAAGAVVTHDVPDGCVVAGVPAKVIAKTSDVVQRLQRDTAQLPWADHPYLQADYNGPADAQLQQWRVQYFFNMPQLGSPS